MKFAVTAYCVAVPRYFRKSRTTRPIFDGWLASDVSSCKVTIGGSEKGSHSIATLTAPNMSAPALKAPSAYAQPEPIAMKSASIGPEG